MKKFLIVVVFLALTAFVFSFFIGDRSSFTANIKETQNRNKEVSVVFVGDIMLSRQIGKLMQVENNWFMPFELVAEDLKNTDIVFGNLESVISDKGKDSGAVYSFRADPRSLEGLLYANFSVVSVANNHSFDWGDSAFLDSIQRLKNSGILPIGGGVNRENARDPVFIEKEGIKFAFLAYSEFAETFTEESFTAPIKEEFLEEDIKKTEIAGADIIIVSFHWGEEYKEESNDFQKYFGRRAIDFGADLVIGHHPHSVQEIENYKNGIIAYSLGNFVFDQNFSEATRKGLILKAVFRDKKISETTPILVKFNKNFQPYFAENL